MVVNGRRCYREFLFRFAKLCNVVVVEITELSADGVVVLSARCRSVLQRDINFDDNNRY